MTSRNQRLVKFVRYPGEGRGCSRNLLMGCVAGDMKFWGYSTGYSVGI